MDEAIYKDLSFIGDTIVSEVYEGVHNEYSYIFLIPGSYIRPKLDTSVPQVAHTLPDTAKKKFKFEHPQDYYERLSHDLNGKVPIGILGNYEFAEYNPNSEELFRTIKYLDEQEISYWNLPPELNAGRKFLQFGYVPKDYAKRHDKKSLENIMAQKLVELFPTSDNIAS